MIRQLRAFLLCLPLLFAPVAPYAQDAAPDSLVKSVTEEVLSILRKDKDLKAGDLVTVAYTKKDGGLYATDVCMIK